MVPPVALPVRLLAPAKINLHLRVGGRRGDGFHPLLTWMCTVGLFDTLTLEAVPGSETPPAAGRAGEPAGAVVLPDLRFDCDQPGLPRDEGNLVVRVARAFAAEVFAPPPLGGGGLSAGASGAKARDGGGDDRREDPEHREDPDPAGAARVEALGMGDADRPASAAETAGGTAREAGAARDAGRPVGRDGAATSDDVGALSAGVAHGRGRKAEAPAAPAMPRSASAPARLTGITLAKRIPVGAGLGGGSSDAARALVGLDRLWQAGRSADQLSGFAARFGSDVPFFVAAAFHGPSAACAGRGEVVRPIPAPEPRTALLVLPPFALATRDVYGRFDAMGLGFDREVADAPDWQGWTRLGATNLLARLVNDLEPAAFSLRPELAELRRAAERSVGRTVRMSGSGSSLFTLFDAGEEAEARAAAGRVRESLGVTAVAVELAPAVDDDLAGRRGAPVRNGAAAPR